MATKFTDLTAASAVEATDLFAITKDPSGTPLSRKATGTQLLSFITQTAKGMVTSASNPTVNDDSGDGYAVGWMWFNTTTYALFILRDATATAAVWKHISPEWQTLESQTPTGSGTITFSNISPLYTDLQWVINGLSHDDASNRQMSMQISDDGTNWSTAVTIVPGNVAAATPIHGIVDLFNYRSAVFKNATSTVQGAQDTSANMRGFSFSTETGIMTHARFVWSAGNNDAGTITMLGR